MSVWAPPRWVPYWAADIGLWFSNLWDAIDSWWKGRMAEQIIIGLVGDLSNCDPWRLHKCVDDAKLKCDIVIQLGDMNEAYDAAMKCDYVICGNHDVLYDKHFKVRNWRTAPMKGLSIVGLDNSNDKFADEVWPLLDSVPKKDVVMLCCHKPLSTIVLLNGGQSQHDMGEGRPCPDANRLIAWLQKRGDDTLCIHGHYHAYSNGTSDYGPYILEGRGGAAGTGPGELGWTKLIATLTPEGRVVLTWTPINLT